LINTMGKSTRLIKQCGACLGAVITKIDLASELSNDEKESLRAALDEHQVIFFPSQNLMPNQQKGATEIFGPLLPSDTFFEHLDDDPYVEVVINDENNPPTGTAKWHADLTWAKEPPAGTSLHSRKIPVGKGDTIWVSMTAAYDSLSERMKKYLDGLKAVHSWDMGLGGRQGIFRRGGDHYIKRKTSNPPIAQPLVRTHPRTGKKLIYVNPGFTSHIVDIPGKESDGILNFLFDLAARPEFQLRHKWDVGTLAVWDNTATQHAAVDDFFPAYRELTRVTFGGHGEPR
jgi:taurine dioxygenase